MLSTVFPNLSQSTASGPAGGAAISIDDPIHLPPTNLADVESTSSQGQQLALNNQSQLAPLDVMRPRGSLVYHAAAEGTIAGFIDFHEYTVDLNDGQQLALVMDPDEGLGLWVDVFGPSGRMVGSVVSEEPGVETVLGPIPITAAGTHRISVSSASSTTGAYSLRLILNALFEDERHGGARNDTTGSAQDVDSLFQTLGDGPAEQVAILGAVDGPDAVTPPNAAGYQAMAVPHEFEDISISGTRILDHADDATAELTATDLSGFAFDFHDITYDSLFIGSNGLITFTAPYESYVNSDLDHFPAGAAIAPLWDDLATTGGADAVYWEVRGTGGDQRLIVQWQDLMYYGGSDTDLVTFQAVLHAGHGTVQFNYLDLATGNATHDEGASATVGLKGPDSGDEQALLLAYNNGPNSFVGTGQSTLIGREIAPAATADFYRFTLSDGDSLSAAVAELTPGSLSLELYDETLSVLARGVAADNIDAVINSFVADHSGTYYVRLAGGDREYNLVLTRNADFDAEPNDELPSAQELSVSKAAVGYLSAGSRPAVEYTATTAGAAATNIGSEPDETDTARLWPSDDGLNQASGSEEAQLPERIIVRFQGALSQRAMRRAVKSLGGSLIRTLPSINGAAVEVNEPGLDMAEAVQQWTASPTVRYAEPDYVLHGYETLPNDASFGRLWALNNTGQTGGTADADIDAPEAWDTFTGSSTVVVASIDTGVDYTHPDLAENMWVNPGEIAGDGIDNDGNGYIDDVHGIDTFSDDSDPMDDVGHGTHTAGTIGAIGNNGLGVTGVNWDVQIMALKFISAAGGYTSDAIAALEYMTMMKTQYGVNVVASNNSWGGGGFSQALKDAILASNEAGILFVAAAGNNGFNMDSQDSREYPAGYDLDGIVSVAATDHNDALATFSNFGAKTVDLGAPGVSILSTLPKNQYGVYDGTSMASPHVAGLAALLMGYNPEASLAEIKRAILDGTDPVASLSDVTVSGGRLNLARSLATMTDQGDYYRIDVAAGDSLAITTFTPSDGPYEVSNTLDPVLELYDPNGTLVATNDNGGPDGRNSALTHSASDAGAYVVRVFSAGGRGEYLLEVSGQTGARQPFQVSSVTPPDGARLPAAPTAVTIEFNDSVLLTSLKPSDIAVDGNPAASIDIVDGRTAVVRFPDLSEGTHELAIAAGSVLDVEQTPLEGFSSQFIIDLTAPRITSSSIEQGDRVATGTLVYTAEFDETLNAAKLDVSDLELRGMLSGLHPPSELLYEAANSTVRVEFQGLLDDDYTLTLFSGDEAFVDVAGNVLDGEPLGYPTGDQVTGGDFVVDFWADSDRTEARDFKRLDPAGSLMFESRRNRGAVDSSVDSDGFTVFLEASQKITARVIPKEPAATMTVELVGIAGTAVSGSAPGKPAVLPPAEVPADDVYELRVSADRPTLYEVWIGLNVAVESAMDDTSDGHALAMDASHTAPGRFGVLGDARVHYPEIGSLVWGVQPATGRIILLDPASGDELYGFSAPDGLLPEHTRVGLTIAEAGDALLYVNADADPTALYRLDPLSGELLSVESIADRPYDGLSFESGPNASAVIYSADMETDPGWRLQGGWAYGIPAGGGSYNGDPTSGVTGDKVVGYNLQGDYANNMSPEYAVMPAFDASDYHVVTLSFYRWLGVESAYGDEVGIEVSSDGTHWSRVWGNSSDFYSYVEDTSWVYQAYDISSIAAGQPHVFIRFGMGPTDDAFTWPGWNIDDVVVSGIYGKPASIFVSESGRAITRQNGYSGALSSYLTPVVPGSGLAGDDAGRHFVQVPGEGIVEYDPVSGTTQPDPLPPPAADIEGMAFDGKQLYVATASEQLYILNPDDGSVVNSMTIAGGGLFGLGSFAFHEESLRVVFAEDFDGAGHTLTLNNQFGSGKGLWHVTSGRQADGLPGHSPPHGLYFGKGEDQFGGGDYDTGIPVAGAAVSPWIQLPGNVPITLSFNALIEIGWEELEVVVDDGTHQTTVLSTLDWSLTPATFGQWMPFSADLSPFAGKDVQLRFTFETYDEYDNAWEGWYIDDIVVSTQVENPDLALPDLDEYAVDLSGRAGKSIDIVLDGQTADFSSEQLELLDADGATVLAVGVPDPLGPPMTNGDLAILGFEVPRDGVYTVRVTSETDGLYGILVTDAITFDAEPHDQLTDPLRNLEVGETTLGYTGVEGGRLFAIQWADFGERARIHELDPQSGDILNTVPAPEGPVTNPYGTNLAFDGENLWYNIGVEWGDNSVYRLNPSDGTILDSFVDADASLFSGLGVVGTELFAMTNTIRVYDISDPEYPLLRSVPTPEAGSHVGLTGNHAASSLYVVAQGRDNPGGSLYELDAVTGEVLRSKPAESEAWEQGMAVVGEELFVSETGGPGTLNQIGVYDLQTLELVRQLPIPLPTMIAGLGGDGFSSEGPDWYKIDLDPGQTLRVRTETPMDHPSAPRNNLDPALTLYNPSGDPVANDLNGFDGKNAQLHHVATAAGTYYIEVYAEDGSGEYTLSLLSPDPPPVVTGVYLGSTDWAPAFRQWLTAEGMADADGYYRLPTDDTQLDTLSWSGLSQLRLTFSEDVHVDIGDLVLVGADTGDVSFTDFAYDAETSTGTWTFPVLEGDKFLLSLQDTVTATASGLPLDGDYTDSSGQMESGDAEPGGDFQFRFNVLPGDVTNSNNVVAGDVSVLASAFGSFISGSEGRYSPFVDFDGSGNVVAGDVSILASHFGQFLPSEEPTVPHDGDAATASTTMSTTVSVTHLPETAGAAPAQPVVTVSSAAAPIAPMAENTAGSEPHHADARYRATGHEVVRERDDRHLTLPSAPRAPAALRRPDTMTVVTDTNELHLPAHVPPAPSATVGTATLLAASHPVVPPASVDDAFPGDIRNRKRNHQRSSLPDGAPAGAYTVETPGLLDATPALFLEPRVSSVTNRGDVRVGMPARRTAIDRFFEELADEPEADVVDLDLLRTVSGDIKDPRLGR